MAETFPEPENTPVPLPTHDTTEWSIWTRRLATILLILGLLVGATLVRGVLSSVILAGLVAFALYFPIGFLAKRLRLGYPLAVLIVFLVYLVLGAIMVVVVGSSILSFVVSLANSVQAEFNLVVNALRNYQAGAPDVTDPLGREIINLVDPFLIQVSALLQTGDTTALQNLIPNLLGLGGVNGASATGGIGSAISGAGSMLGSAAGAAGTVLGTAASAAGTISGFIGQTFLINFLALLFLLEIPNAFRWTFRITAPQYKREIAILAHRIAQVWVGFFRGQLTISIIIGVLTGIQLTLMGIDGALVIALFVIIVSLIPMLGGIIALIPLVLVPLLQGSTVFPDMIPGTLMLLVVLPNFIVQQVIWNLVAPKVTGDAVALPVPIIIIGLIMGSQVYGILGALLAAPVMGILKVIVEYMLHKIQAVEPFPGIDPPDWISGRFADILD